MQQQGTYCDRFSMIFLLRRLADHPPALRTCLPKTSSPPHRMRRKRRTGGEKRIQLEAVQDHVLSADTRPVKREANILLTIRGKR